MIRRVELQERAAHLGLAEAVVEKDYAIGWVLWGIAQEPTLRDSWIFKGGTCLKKCYIETYRFSEDLDFTVLPSSPMDGSAIEEALISVAARVQNESGIDFAVESPRIELFREGRSGEGRIYYSGPRHAPAARIKLDLRTDEVVVEPPVLRPIGHVYSDGLPANAEVRCYGFHELFAEKIRALGERCRPRDLYDVVNLYWRPEFREHGPLVRQVLDEKCSTKGIKMVTIGTIEQSPYRVDVENTWSAMLGHQLGTLPEFEHYWEALPEIFRWLDGNTTEELQSLGAEGGDLLWAPPQTFWQSGVGAVLEPVRFAGANRVCVELQYGGRSRVIEPYSLRRTLAGDIVLHGIRVDNREHRSYRVDRIQGIRVTRQPFQPAYAVEFFQEGEISVLPTRRDPRPTSNTRARVARPRRTRRSNYVLECLACGKRFYREKPSTRLGKHKTKDGYACYSRSGSYV